MTLTVVYVRVSTEDQVDYSPEAQATRCRQYCRLHDLGATTVIADEGWSGKNLERPGVRRLLELVEAEQVAHVVVRRLDRLSRDTGDLYDLVRLMERHCVSLHSVNEGQVDLATATGRMQVGMHGVFAQFQREQIVENVKMGMEQAIRGGRWLNRAPTGYDMVNGELVPNEQAPLVVRIFELRARGSQLRRHRGRRGDLVLDGSADPAQQGLPGTDPAQGSMVSGNPSGAGEQGGVPIS
jgi:site-specific DNA recombinase